MSNSGIFGIKLIVCIIVVATYVDLIVLPWLVEHDLVMKILVIVTVLLTVIGMKIKHDTTH